MGYTSFSLAACLLMLVGAGCAGDFEGHASSARDRGVRIVDPSNCGVSVVRVDTGRAASHGIIRVEFDTATDASSPRSAWGMVVVNWGHEYNAQTGLRVPKVSASREIELRSLPDRGGALTCDFVVDLPLAVSSGSAGFTDVQIVLSDEPPYVLMEQGLGDPERYLLLAGGRYRASQFASGVHESAFLLENISGTRVPPCEIQVRMRGGSESVRTVSSSVLVRETLEGESLRLSFPTDGTHSSLTDLVWVMETRRADSQ